LVEPGALGDTPGGACLPCLVEVLVEAERQPSLRRPGDRRRELEVVTERERESCALDRRLDRELSALDGELSELESEEQTVAIKIVSRPEFAYVVSENSDRLAKQLAGIEKRFDEMFDALSVSRRTDVLALKESLTALRTGLSAKNGLEHDVLQALVQEAGIKSSRWQQAGGTGQRAWAG
jgi:polyhydroxyalkanoate synthesis regulator phasin